MLPICSRSRVRTNQKHCQKISRRSVSRVLSTSVKTLDGHSSGTCFATRLARPTRAADRKYSRFRAYTRSRPPLFGLAPGGVYPAGLVTKTAVRSYRPVSPFPMTEAKGGLFSVALPWGRPRRPLAGTVFPWSPDFPPPGSPPGSGRPTVWMNNAWACLWRIVNLRPENIFRHDDRNRSKLHRARTEQGNNYIFVYDPICWNDQLADEIMMIFAPQPNQYA